MFKFLKKKTENEKRIKQYEDLLKKSFELSKTNRTESDKAYAQAQELLQQIETTTK